MITLRPYQDQIIDDLFRWFETHAEGHCIIDACVGAGKSILLAEICRYILTQWPDQRILMVVASKELITQNLEKLIAVWPDAPVGVYSAALNRRQAGHPITYATIGTIARRAMELGRTDLVLIDEAHNVNPRNAGMYRQLVAGLERGNPDVRIVGWTGTPFRGDGVWLTDGDSPIFTHIAARVTMTDLLEQGYLAPLNPATTSARIDTTGVEIDRLRGDYKIAQLEAAADREAITEAACDEIVRLGAARRAWLVYGVTIAHAEHLCAALDARGVAVALVTSKTPVAERDRAIADFRAGRLRALVNVGVLTVGFDAPHADLIALLRPTQSPVLYVQIAGRGMRTAPGKVDCLWLDFTDTTTALGPVDVIRGRAARKTARGGEAPVRVCDNCGARCATALRECSECGHVFPEPERLKHAATASGAAVLSSQVAEQRVEITDVDYAAHRKPGKPPSLRVDYRSGLLRVASEWICLEHDGYARAKAVAWWRRRAGASAPRTVADALQVVGELPKPSAITVQRQGRFTEVCGVEFAP